MRSQAGLHRYEHYDDPPEGGYGDDEEDEETYSSGLDDWEDEADDLLSPSDEED